jgi:peptidoglycan/xylan/chitin deacetylase (PgdA/CDA1 family)
MSFFKPSVSLLLIYSAIIASLTKVWAAELITQCKPGYVAITYDDGPYQYTSELINLLDREGVKATFFVNGQNFW